MTSVLKPQAPVERLKFSNDCPEVALNKSIILQAIIDSSSSQDGISGTKIARSAHNWLFGNSENFKQTCINASLESNFVVKIARQMINLHSKSQMKPLIKKSFSTQYKEREEIKENNKKNLKSVSFKNNAIR